jgi:hypothetical protein
VFYRLADDGPEVVGRVRLVDGEVEITTVHLRMLLDTTPELYGYRLDPADGQAYLDLLPQVFFSTYFWAAQDEEDRE